MDNVRTIYLDWNTGGIVRSDSGAYLARQYDHLSNLIVFRNAPGLENYYLIVEMKENEDDLAARSMEPILLPGPYWLVPNVYTQLVQPVTFQVCCKTESGDFEQHSAKFKLNVIESLRHDGAELDVDPSPMYDAYEEYVDEKVQELIDEAGGISIDTRAYVDQKITEMVAAAGEVIIDSTLSISGAAADAKATGDAISNTNERLDEYEDIFTGDVGESVENWLNEHPEATTTVEDESLTYKKLVPGTLGFKTPEMFGAVGDGDSDNATDDTTALQSAISGGGVVHLKSGATYLISGTITISAPVIVYGHGATIKQSAVRTNTLYATDVSNITIDGVHIVGYGNDYVGQGGQIAPFGIRIRGTSENHVSNIAIRNCIVDYCTWTGIHVSSADNVLIENNTVLGTGENDLEYESNYQFGISFNDCKNIKVTGNDVSETAQGFYIGKKVYNAVISDNVIHDIPGQHGVYATSGIDFIFTGNVIKDIAIEGFKLQLDANSEENASGINISNNSFLNIGSFAVHTVNTGAPSNQFIIENVIVNDNIMKNCALASLFSAAKNVSVKGNMVTDGSEGLMFSRVIGTFTISGNTICNLQRRAIGNYAEGVTLNSVFICKNVIRECGQENLATNVCNAINITSAVFDSLTLDGNTVSDANRLMRYAVNIGGANFSGPIVFVNNHIYDKTTILGATLKEFSNNVCEGGLSINAGATTYGGMSANLYTGASLPTDVSGYKNGDIFVLSDLSADGYAFAVFLNNTWAMLGKKDDYVIHPVNIETRAQFTINSASVVSEGNKLTINVNVTINVRGTESVAGNFSADSSLLPAEKTRISGTDVGVFVNSGGYISISTGTVGRTYDVTGIFIDGVLQTE